MSHKVSRRESNTPKEKPTNESLSYNLEEQLDTDERPSSTKHVKSATSKAKDAETTHASLTKINTDVDVNAVPDPIPDTGLSLTTSLPGTLTVYTGVPPAIASATHTPGFSPLPSLTPPPALITSVASTPYSLAPSHNDNAASAALDSQGPQTQTHPARQLSAVIIVLIGIGSAFLLLLVFVLCRMFRKRRRWSYPTPSRPILQDPFADRATDGDEESLFGGKERISGRPGSNGLWTWTQYPHPSLEKSQVIHAINEHASNGSTRRLVEEAQQLSSCYEEKHSTTAVSHRLSRADTTLPPPVQQTLGRAAKRVSAVSASIYPGSPQSTLDTSAIGLAIGSASPFTADGTPLLQRNASKASNRRMSRSRRSVRYSLHENVNASVPADAYDGVQASSRNPSPGVVHRKSSSLQGRARVKAPYAPGSVLRASSTVAAFAAAQSNPFDDSQYVLPPLSPALKTEATRERDTKALTSALGLASPPPLSPQPTLYPDDSITLAGDRRNKRNTRPQSQLLSPSTEASARLGNLMLAEFSSMASLPSTRTIAGTGESTLTRNRSRKRTDDKPPRVPSPPPMPSLAQMALAHTNPDDFADYRSPTYSIYGLYETDRKSRAPGEGGY
ncbi:uncharacterized protein LAESUDRAFT_741804 [Laetiporus sulphureus 93-53]|uniref:Uncharacterized protein n=1 Tax=Laetiporus sulphureus 93-53 TaxID=1314785 RepID=A0A165FX57_9APHY|nr:uncharacterized protein LAESUDRAFT_741804 [Laetiporus sulphureus 93-53]KZT09529.1 hypothetical protein LAESUDRAFT_741804 [Laetiporus sulphureus 93-53]